MTDVHLKYSICRSCTYRREIKNARGSVFWMCEKNRENPHFPKYPHQPVMSCTGYQKEA